MFVSDGIGLIIAFLNVTTFLLLVYLFLDVVARDRSRVYRVLDRIFTPVLSPVRRVLPRWKIDISPVLVATFLQVISRLLKKKYW